VVWLILLALYAGAIFAISSLPLTNGEPLLPFPNGDKLLHFLEFSLFFFLSWKAIPARRRVLCALLITALYAGSDEIHQIFVATRTASLLDWLADFAGGATTAGLTILLARTSLFTVWGRRILGRCDKKEG
jgi:VanZ family protein